MPDAAPRSILLVEDDPIVRMLMVDVLEDAGHHVIEADGWDTAIAVLANPAQAVALLITDVGLGGTPDRDGLGLAREALRLREGLPVLVASGYVGPAGGTGEALDIPPGAEQIGKPFSIDQLRDKVQGLLA
ncbi:response regulator [Pseudomonas typographi]|uniref:response regulator n=1 Tax=Pseudomonas typographi TaxID=2715964 RepID=UPI0016892681|nr:response regulator [Pseudomonas typographi]MBD1553798.1 response regulator [Pseudomonas typographi]MBD1588491.1 response regulator [Pseudomonas typographi]